MRRIAFFLFTASSLTFFCSMSFEKAGDTWWYVRGQPYYWFYQSDVYAFRTIDGQRWKESLDTNCVKYIFHRSEHLDKLNVIYFKPCSEEDKNSVKEMIRSGSQFEAEFPVITLLPDKPYSAAHWFVLDDLLLVNFNPDSLTKNRFNQFKLDYSLEQINFPDSVFPEGIFTYIFRFDFTEMMTTSSIDLAKTIYMQDSGLVTNVQPNLINAYEKVPDESVGFLGNDNSVLTEDEVEYYLVHDQNKKVKLFVKLNGDSPLAMIRVYDLFGREIYGFQAIEEVFEHDINISDYASGIYFASIENERGEVMGVQKFVKL